jgi:hypothetical protein
MPSANSMPDRTQAVMNNINGLINKAYSLRSSIWKEKTKTLRITVSLQLFPMGTTQGIWCVMRNTNERCFHETMSTNKKSTYNFQNFKIAEVNLPLSKPQKRGANLNE